MKTKQSPNNEKIDARNFITACVGERVIERDEDGWVTFGFKNLRAWLPKDQKHVPLSNDPDKFLVTAENFETASSEFYARWKIYVQRRFKLPYVNIESN